MVNIMELCPRCGKMTAEYSLYTGVSICYNKDCNRDSLQYIDYSNACKICGRFCSDPNHQKMMVVPDEKYPNHVKYVKKPARKIEINKEDEDVK